MTVTLKHKTKITVPKSIRRKAGLKPGDQVEFKVSDRTITIVPKLTPDEIQDEREIRDPKIRAAIRKSYQEFLAGESRPIQELFAARATRSKSKRRKDWRRRTLERTLTWGRIACPPKFRCGDPSAG
jgi:AbrB family looped-hinge helix DNA binding protein